jgi:hypothetical protein
MKMSSSETPPASDDLAKVIWDFTRDVLTTFPERKEGLNRHLANIASCEDETKIAKDDIDEVRKHLKVAYPPRFFDILYQNEEMYTQDDPLELLPGIDFKELWSANISDSTRKTIWKYLQLVLFTLVAKMEDGASFGDAASLFEAIDPEEFRSKLEETIDEMQSCFKAGEDGDKEESGEGDKGQDTEKGPELPDPKVLHEHVKEMMGGKLGQLAREIADEAAKELGLNDPEKGDHRSAFQALMKNPMKLMSLVKKVGGKLNEKIKSGEIKEAELLKEATEIVEKMKNVPGMGGLESLLRRGGGKPDFSAMEAHLRRNTRMAGQRDRMRAKLAERQRAAAAAAAAGGDISPGVPQVSAASDTTQTGGKKKRRKKKKQRAK